MHPFPRPPGHAIPKFWRPKVTHDQQLRCQIIHWDLLTAFTQGTAHSATLWDWIETGFTYMQMMRLLMADGTDFADEAIGAMNAQIQSYEAVIARFRATGRVGFDARQLATARAAAGVMDGLIEMDRHGIADAAAHWSMAQMCSLRASGRVHRPAEKKRKKK